MMKLYVGNLSFNTTEAELRALFEPFGVTSASLVMDRESGRPRGFGFVEVDGQQGAAAIAAVNGKNIGGRDLTVNEAKPRESRSSGGGGGGWGRSSGGSKGGSGGRGGW